MSLVLGVESVLVNQASSGSSAAPGHRGGRRPVRRAQASTSSFPASRLVGVRRAALLTAWGGRRTARCGSAPRPSSPSAAPTYASTTPATSWRARPSAHARCRGQAHRAARAALARHVASGHGDLRVRYEDVRCGRTDVAAREGSVPVVHRRQRHHPRPATRLRASRAADGPRHVDRAAASPARASGAGQPDAADVVDDTAFDIRFHVRTSPAQAGTVRQLFDLASLITNDRSIAPDRCGSSTSSTVEGQQVGARREAAPHHRRRRRTRAAEPRVPRLRARRARATATRSRGGRRRHRARRTQRRDVLRGLLGGSLRMPLGLLRQLRDLLQDPMQIPAASNATAETVRGVLSQLGDTDKARSPLWTQRSLRRRIEVLRARTKRLGPWRPSSWQAEHRVLTVAARPRAATTSRWARRSRLCALDGDQHTNGGRERTPSHWRAC